MHYFCLFYSKLYKPCVNLARVWTRSINCTKGFDEILKILDENSIEKLSFKVSFGKVDAKNRAFGNNIIFLQQFFQFREWNAPSVPPYYATVSPQLWVPSKNILLASYSDRNSYHLCAVRISEADVHIKQLNFKSKPIDVQSLCLGSYQSGYENIIILYDWNSSSLMKFKFD